MTRLLLIALMGVVCGCDEPQKGEMGYSDYAISQARRIVECHDKGGTPMRDIEWNSFHRCDNGGHNGR